MSFARTAFIAILGSAASLALATTFLERPFPETVEEAPNIVRGTVGNSYSDWSKPDETMRRIYTYSELQVSEVFKGSLPKGQITIRELGGSKDGLGMEVAGTAKFNRGEDVVVMLGPSNSDGSYDVRGMMMGKYNIERDAEGVEYLSGPGLASSPHAHRGEETGGQADTKRWTLDALRKLIQSEKDKNSQASSASPAPLPNKERPAAAANPSPSVPVKNPADGPSAPQLQQTANCEPSEPCSETASSKWWIWGMVGIGGLGLLLLVLRMIRSR